MAQPSGATELGRRVGCTVRVVLHHALTAPPGAELGVVALAEAG